MLVKICSRCNQERPLSNFSEKKRLGIGLGKICISCQEYNKNYLLKNKERLKPVSNERTKKWNKNNRSKIRKYEKKYYRENINHRLKKNLRSAVYHLSNGEQRTSKFLEYNMEELKKCLENQFIENMSWDNYGKVWHIDHIIPASLYELSKKKEIQKCFNLRNLRPLKCQDNQVKWKKLDMKLVEEHKIEDLLPRRVITF